MGHEPAVAWFGRDELAAAGEAALRRCTDPDRIRAQAGDRTPLLRRGPAGKFGDLMDLTRLDDLLNDSILRVLDARTLLAGELVAASSEPASGDLPGRAGPDVATAATVYRHVALGATLSLQGCSGSCRRSPSSADRSPRR